MGRLRSVLVSALPVPVRRLLRSIVGPAASASPVAQAAQRLDKVAPAFFAPVDAGHPLRDIVPPFDAEASARWDREWLRYFGSESMYPHLATSDRIAVVGELAGKSSREAFHGRIAQSDAFGFGGPLRVWCEGDRIIDANILEIGCGCGVTAKQLAPFCKSYLGLDQSLFALTIARSTTAGNCQFLHISDAASIATHAARYDVLVGREFFIHQNLDSALAVLRLARFLLKGGGIACADFYHKHPGDAAAALTARESLDADRLSAGFHFDDDALDELLRRSGFELIDSIIDIEERRRFVTMRAPLSKGHAP